MNKVAYRVIDNTISAKVNWNKIVPVTLVFWMIIELAPFVHQLGEQSGQKEWIVSQLFYVVGMFLPVFLLLAILKNQKTPQWMKSQSLWLAIFYSILAAIFGFIIWSQLLGHYARMRGSAPTFGLVIAAGLYIMYRFRAIGFPQSAFLGMMAAAFVTGGKEIPYQVVGYFLLWSSYFSWTGTLGLSITMTCVALPFVIALYYYNIKPTKLTLYSLIAYIIAMLIWIIPFHYWSIIKYISPEYAILNTPINWAGYTAGKVASVAFCSMLLGLKQNKGGVKCWLSLQTKKSKESGKAGGSEKTGNHT